MTQFKRQYYEKLQILECITFYAFILNYAFFLSISFKDTFKSVGQFYSSHPLFIQDQTKLLFA